MSKKPAKALEYNIKFTPTLNPKKPFIEYTPEEQQALNDLEQRWAGAPAAPAPLETFKFVADLIKNWKSYPIGAIITLYPDGRVTFETYKTKEDPRASIHTGNAPAGI